jgi:hypothetical protein
VTTVADADQHERQRNADDAGQRQECDARPA